MLGMRQLLHQFDRDTPRGKRAGGSGRALRIPHLPQPSLLASVNLDVATVPALPESGNASAREGVCRCGGGFHEYSHHHKRTMMGMFRAARKLVLKQVF